MGTRWLAIAASITATAALGAVPALAAATTICVPGFSAQCPNANGNVAKADLEEAMSFQATDGIADTIFVGAGTFTETDAVGAFEPGGGSSKTSFEATGSDPLTIVGAGPGVTVMTSTSAANEYLLNLSHNNSRAITVRDLTVRLPASYPDGGGSGYGAGVYLYNGDVLDNVDIVSLNPESNGTAVFGAGNVIRNGELRGSGAGSIGNGFAASGAGTLLVEDSVVRGASWALFGGSGGTLTARRVAVVGARTYGAVASSGSVALENTTITTDDGIGLYASAAATDVSLTADHVTIVNSGDTYPALEGKKFSSSAGDVTMTVSNSILRGFASGYKTETPFGPGIGFVSLTARYSNLPQNGTDNGGNADFATGNFDADPLLAADFSLPPGSPSVDAGDPALAGLAVDFLGAPRPNDGNGDGVAVRDQGAFEYQRPAPPGGGGANGGGQGGPADTVAPQTTIKSGPGNKLAEGKAKFAFRSSEPGSSFRCKLDAKKVSRCKSPRTYKRLQPGRHTFRVWATDAAGNKDPTPAKRRFRVPAEDSLAR